MVTIVFANRTLPVAAVLIAQPCGLSTKQFVRS